MTQNGGDRITGWTVDTLHVHLAALLREKDLRDNATFREKDVRDQQRFDAQQLALRDALLAQEKAVSAALLAAQEAVAKAETAAEKRFDSVNEFRAQLADQAANLMPRSETAVLLAGVNEKIADIQNRANEQNLLSQAQTASGAGRSAGLNQAWGYLVGAAGVVAAIIALVVK